MPDNSGHAADYCSNDHKIEKIYLDFAQICIALGMNELIVRKGTSFLRFNHVIDSKESPINSNTLLPVNLNIPNFQIRFDALKKIDGTGIYVKNYNYI